MQHLFASSQGRWSGEASRRGGFREDEQQVNITFGDDSNQQAEAKKELPTWMTKSTVTRGDDPSEASMAAASASAIAMDDDSTNMSAAGAESALTGDDEITSLLLKHEKRDASQKAAPYIPGAGGGGGAFGAFGAHNSDSGSDDSEPEDLVGGQANPASSSQAASAPATEDVEAMSDDEDDGAGDVPTVKVAGKEHDLTDVISRPELIEQMTAEEKERYTQVYQDFYEHMYD